MKKVSFMMIAAFVAVSSMFVSCGEEDEPGVVTVTVDAAEVAHNAAVTGKIKSTYALKDVQLLLDGNSVSGWPITKFEANPIVGKDGDYTFRIENLAAGQYTIEANDKDGVRGSATFTVKAAPVKVPDFTGATDNITVKVGDIIYYKPAADETGSIDKKIEITEASATKITLKLDGKTEVAVLDDATSGHSYLRKDGTTYSLADAQKDETVFLLAKKAGSAMLCSGNSSQLNTKFSKATPVEFTTKTKEE
jgi:hypothetical protein